MPETSLKPFPIANREAVEKVRQELLQCLKYKSSLEIGFITSRDGVVSCFHRKTFYITDLNLLPILFYESRSFIHACSISNGTKYAVCQMAYNREGDEDSGAMALFDVKRKNLISRRVIRTGWKGLRNIFIDDEKDRIFCYYDDEVAEYDLSLSLLKFS